jgi:hypothetical protein
MSGKGDLLLTGELAPPDLLAKVAGKSERVGVEGALCR